MSHRHQNRTVVVVVVVAPQTVRQRPALTRSPGSGEKVTEAAATKQDGIPLGEAEERWMLTGNKLEGRPKERLKLEREKFQDGWKAQRKDNKSEEPAARR